MTLSQKYHLNTTSKSIQQDTSSSEKMNHLTTSGLRIFWTFSSAKSLRSHCFSSILSQNPHTPLIKSWYNSKVTCISLSTHSAHICCPKQHFRIPLWKTTLACKVLSMKSPFLHFLRHRTQTTSTQQPRKALLNLSQFFHFINHIAITHFMFKIDYFQWRLLTLIILLTFSTKSLCSHGFSSVLTTFPPHPHDSGLGEVASQWKFRSMPLYDGIHCKSSASFMLPTSTRDSHL
jgi:hypothetical protein